MYNIIWGEITPVAALNSSSNDFNMIVKSIQHNLQYVCLFATFRFVLNIFHKLYLGHNLPNLFMFTVIINGGLGQCLQPLAAVKPAKGPSFCLKDVVEINWVFIMSPKKREEVSWTKEMKLVFRGSSSYLILVKKRSIFGIITSSCQKHS